MATGGLEYILDSSIKRVVIGMLDPNPDICGRGAGLLERNGVDVGFFPPNLRDEIRLLNMKFIREQSDLKTIGIERAYRDQAASGLLKALYLYKPREVDILQTYVQHVNTMETGLLETLKDKRSTVRFVLMDPDKRNNMVDKRALDLGIEPDSLRSSIRDCIRDITNVGKNARGGKLRIWLHRGIPYIHMYRLDSAYGLAST